MRTLVAIRPSSSHAHSTRAQAFAKLRPHHRIQCHGFYTSAVSDNAQFLGSDALLELSQPLSQSSGAGNDLDAFAEFIDITSAPIFITTPIHHIPHSFESRLFLISTKLLCTTVALDCADETGP